MEYTFDALTREADVLAAGTGLIPPDLAAFGPPNPRVQADLAMPVFRIAQERAQPPPTLAAEIAAAMQVGPRALVGEVSASGPYVNVSVAPGPFAAAVLADVERLGEAYGEDDLGAGRTVVVDYSAPNVAKRMHVGHVRSTVIGQALVNLLRRVGYHTVGDNHIGDWGKSFGVLLTGLDHEGVPDGAGEALLVALEVVYARWSARAAEDPDVDAAARAWSLRLERGDPTARTLWQRAVDLTTEANRPSYERLDVRFDLALGESFYEPLLAGVVADALRSGVGREDEEGAVVVDLPDLPTFLLRRSDGGTLYHTRDAATIKYRVETFRPAQIVYVVGEPQALYFRQLFALADALGYAPGVNLVHRAFGTVFGPDGRALSTRRGNMVTLESLLDEAHARARAVVERGGGDLGEGERELVAEAVGVGAVVYNDLHQDPRRNLVLDWDRMLALDGDSAAYAQYMHARCRSILRRADIHATEGEGAAAAAVLVHPSEQALVKQLARLPQAAREAANEHALVPVAAWCHGTARAFAAFYRDCPVLLADDPTLRAARLRLVRATAVALVNGLGVLGLSAPERM